jgi:apolipoprotein N-acyltransferase
VLRASNNGLSAVIDPRGNVLALAPQFVQTVLTVDVQPMQGATPYVRFGNWLIVTIMLGLVVVAWARERASRATRRAG